VISSPIACESRIERVVVYARGAVVTRRVTLPAALPEGPVELCVAGATALAEIGSVRALAAGHAGGPGTLAAREVTALQARVIVPAVTAPPTALRERVRDLALEERRLDAEREALGELRDALADLSLDPALPRWARGVDSAARFGDALAISALVGAERERVDALFRDMAVAQQDNRRAREAAAIALSQGTPADLADPARAQLEVRVRLGAGAALESLAIEYVVRGARWWPAYTARFTAAATQVALALDALVAQASGEDWSGVELSLSTADLAQDARLPELRSQRFGRAQPPPRRGYRPPPGGLDALFEGYDRAVLEHTGPDLACLAAEGVADDDTEDLRSHLGGPGGGPPRGSTALKEVTASLSMPQAAPPPRGESAQPLPSFGSMPASLSAKKAIAPSAARLRAAPLPPSASGSVLMDSLEDDDRWSGPPGEPEPPPAVEPSEAWLDFDTLILADAGDPAHRGRLTRDREATPTPGASPSLEALAGPPLACDPLTGRGRFDHRHDARGTRDVPSTGLPHRVAVTTADAPAVPRFVAVPREVAEVFREVEIQNPFAAPLLSGPVDVFLDGALMTTAQLAFVDRAGWIRLGLGVEERLRIARNARVEEGTSGLLGGSAVIDHAVTIDLASSLGKKVTVEVLERVPVTDDKDVEIKLTYSRPEHTRYTQVASGERGDPLRRGLRFTVDVPAGDKARIELGYRVTLPARNEIVGGNRRE